MAAVTETELVKSQNYKVRTARVLLLLRYYIRRQYPGSDGTMLKSTIILSAPFVIPRFTSSLMSICYHTKYGIALGEGKKATVQSGYGEIQTVNHPAL